jgi:serine/threonine protein kinase
MNFNVALGNVRHMFKRISTLRGRGRVSPELPVSPVLLTRNYTPISVLNFTDTDTVNSLKDMGLFLDIKYSEDGGGPVSEFIDNMISISSGKTDLIYEFFRLGCQDAKKTVEEHEVTSLDTIISPLLGTNFEYESRSFFERLLQDKSVDLLKKIEFIHFRYEHNIELSDEEERSFSQAIIDTHESLVYSLKAASSDEEKSAIREQIILVYEAVNSVGQDDGFKDIRIPELSSIPLFDMNWGGRSRIKKSDFVLRDAIFDESSGKVGCSNPQDLEDISLLFSELRKDDCPIVSQKDGSVLVFLNSHKDKSGSIKKQLGEGSYKRVRTVIKIDASGAVSYLAIVKIDSEGWDEYLSNYREKQFLEKLRGCPDVLVPDTFVLYEGKPRDVMTEGGPSTRQRNIALLSEVGVPLDVGGASGAVDFNQLKTYMFQAARGLADMEARGCMHRDVKQENTLLVESAGELRLKLIDPLVLTTLDKESSAGTYLPDWWLDIRESSYSKFTGTSDPTLFAVTYLYEDKLVTKTLDMKTIDPWAFAMMFIGQMSIDSFFLGLTELNLSEMDSFAFQDEYREFFYEKNNNPDLVKLNVKKSVCSKEGHEFNRFVKDFIKLTLAISTDREQRKLAKLLLSCLRGELSSTQVYEHPFFENCRAV